MSIKLFVLLMIFLVTATVFAQDDEKLKEEAREILDARSPDREDGTYGLAGELVFKEAFVIEGKIEKPMVTIFLPKEQVKIGSFIFDKSFKKEEE